MLKPKDKAPAFALPSTSGRTVSTKELLGRRFVLYFYPRDDTPGCTREACDFRDNLARLGAAKVAVYGVSKDGIASHEKFRAKYALPFELLSDADNRVAEQYGAYGEKTLYGKKVTGVIRSTFLVDAGGRIERVWSPVRVDGHVDEVLDAVRFPGRDTVASGSRAKNAAKTTAGPKRAGTIERARAASRKPSAGTPRKRSAGSKATKPSAKSTSKRPAGAAKKSPTSRTAARGAQSK